MDITKYKTCDEVDEAKLKLQQELDVANNSYAEVEDKRLNIQRMIIDLQLQKKDLEIILNKSSNNVKTLKNDISILTNLYWKIKNS